MKKRVCIHYLILIGAIALGAILRFWHLDLKPLWMDEVITAIFSLGKSYNDLPLGVVFPLERVQEIFTFQPKVSCAEIAENIARQSTHPPLFFCSMHAWLGWLSPLGQEWVEKLRSLPALFGVGAIAAIYAVNLAFSKTSGLTAAAVMAVSPFAVYLSQEARHYTLPMLLITLGLLGLMQIQQDIFLKQKVRFFVWFSWAIINSIALYVHYFCVLAFLAQIATLILLIYYPATKSIKQIKRQIWFALILSISAVAISFIPWLMVTLSHFHRSETDWLNSPAHIAPFYQTLINWVLMVISLPVENQPLPIAIISGLLMLIFAIWVGRQIFLGLRVLWGTPKTHLATLTLLSFSGWVLLEFFAIVYFLNKDITIVPRYNFVYYPSFCALIAASLNKSQNSSWKVWRDGTGNRHTSSLKLLHPRTGLAQLSAKLKSKNLLIFFLVGVISSIFVVSNLVFEKPFKPEQVARNINQNPAVPLMVVMAYRDYQDVALGLSFALEVEKVRKIIKSEKLDKFAFFKNSQELSVWQQLSQLPAPAISQMNLWVIAPGIKRRDYPPQIAMSRFNCTIDSRQHYRIGVPYQLYRCM
ncbi:glycosyltransferase family 39 protein [Tolypothrix sp. VBCCA 56010]|uniref:glycosyltransferase family 39 protein n=1 Tax=Tolypothrix sp. VBCCA 56010 TaxID=3137731 RepID=UPI003D7CE3D6